MTITNLAIIKGDKLRQCSLVSFWEINPEKDGSVRNVEFKTASSKYKRPISKIDL